MCESLLPVRRLLWRTQQALPASCSSRLLLLWQPRFHHIKLLLDEVAQLDISAKVAGVMLKFVPGVGTNVCVFFYTVVMKVSDE